MASLLHLPGLHARCLAMAELLPRLPDGWTLVVHHDRQTVRLTICDAVDRPADLGTTPAVQHWDRASGRRVRRVHYTAGVQQNPSARIPAVETVDVLSGRWTLRAWCAAGVFHDPRPGRPAVVERAPTGRVVRVEHWCEGAHHDASPQRPALRRWDPDTRHLVEREYAQHGLAQDPWPGRPAQERRDPQTGVVTLTAFFTAGQRCDPPAPRGARPTPAVTHFHRDIGTPVTRLHFAAGRRHDADAHTPADQDLDPLTGTALHVQHFRRGAPVPAPTSD